MSPTMLFQTQKDENMTNFQPFLPFQYAKICRNFIILQPCSVKSGNPVLRTLPKMSPVDSPSKKHKHTNFQPFLPFQYAKICQNFIIWQPCSGKSGSPVCKRLSKMSPVDSPSKKHKYTNFQPFGPFQYAKTS